MSENQKQFTQTKLFTSNKPGASGNNRLRDENNRLIKKNAILKEQNVGFRRLQKFFGPLRLEEMLTQAKAPKEHDRQEKQATIA